jgi:histidine phosphotransfer protein HptB
MTPCKSAAERSPICSELSNDTEFRELIRVFTDALPDRRETLLALHGNGAIEELGVCAHQLKGAGAGYGFPGLTTASARLEQSCRQRDTEQIAKAVSELVNYINRIVV